MKAPLVAFTLVLLQISAAHAACEPNKPNDRPNGQYVIKGATVYDRKTKLTWQRCSVGQSWQDGKGCQGAVSGVTRLQAEQLETDGWRLPTIDELSTLVSHACARPSINETVFPGMDAHSLYYWSSTSPREAALNYLNFENGTVSADGDEEPYSVRLVRSST